MIICFTFEEIYESEFVLEDSFICENIIEKLIYYFLVLPVYFDIDDHEFLLDIAYNLKQTFPSCYKKFFDFWDFISFFNKFFNTIRSIKLKERIKILFFNDFLIKYIQPRLSSCNLKIIRSTIQYIVLMISLINDIEIINLIYNFLFGFNDSKTNYVFTYNVNEETATFTNSINNSNNNSTNNSIVKDNNNFTRTRTNGHSKKSSIASIASVDLNELQNLYILNNNQSSNKKNSFDASASKNTLNDFEKNNYFSNSSRKNFNEKTPGKNDTIENISNFANENFTRNFYENQDYNFRAHNNIAIGLKIFNNMNNPNESINLVISVLFEKLFEKVPISMFNRLIFPFAEFCTKELDDDLVLTKQNNKIPDLNAIFNIIRMYDDPKDINSYFEENIVKASYKTLNHYIKNDFDFYFYYLSARQDQENFDYLNDNSEEIENQKFNKSDEENIKENLNREGEKKNIFFEEIFPSKKEEVKTPIKNPNNPIQASNNRSSILIAYNNMNEISIKFYLNKFI